ncbi:MAG: hypothetical protein INR62_13380 [Rhodospirillales bacterium]|nr:hypothetical protein [Acetobacter sp.]
MIQDQYLALQGPVERRGNQFIFRVPLEAGGHQLKNVAHATAFEEGNDLVVLLPDWLATRMQLCEGAELHIDDRWGRLNITRLH